MDDRIFLFLNGFSGSNTLFDLVVQGTAIYGIFIIPLFIIGLRQWRYVLLWLLYAVSLSYAANAAIAALWYRDRPFIAHPATVLVDTSSLFDSFPSDHAALAAAMAITILFASRGWRGCIAVVFALLVAISRVFAGVHYVSDILAGLGIGIIAAVFVQHFMNKGRKSH